MDCTTLPATVDMVWGIVLMLFLASCVIAAIYAICKGKRNE